MAFFWGLLVSTDDFGTRHFCVGGFFLIYKELELVTCWNKNQLFLKIRFLMHNYWCVFFSLELANWQTWTHPKQKNSWLEIPIGILKPITLKFTLGNSSICFMGLLMQTLTPKHSRKPRVRTSEIKLFQCLEDSGQQEIGKTVNTQILRQPEPFCFAMSI